MDARVGSLATGADPDGTVKLVQQWFWLAAEIHHQRWDTEVVPWRKKTSLIHDYRTARACRTIAYPGTVDNSCSVGRTSAADTRNFKHLHTIA